MKILKITNFKDINKINDYIKEDFIVDLEDATIAVRRRVIDFLAGFTFLNKRLEKRNKYQYIVGGIYENNC